MGQSKKAVAISSRRPAAWQIDWNAVVKEAEQIVRSYDTGVTLRQLYYRLVALQRIPNNVNTYKHLSRKTAQARREGWFPSLIDRTRFVERFDSWDHGKDSVEQMIAAFRLDRTTDQPYQIYLGVEKHGLTEQLMHWFGHMGLPILALGGYSSQTFVDTVIKVVERDGRDSVLLYAGDFDPSGMDIDRDFKERTECFDQVVRIGLNRKLVDKFELPPAPGKATDSRSAQFMLEHGELVQVELDALPPEELRKLYQRHIDKFWEPKTYERVLAAEKVQREHLVRLGKLIESDGQLHSGLAANRLIKELDNRHAAVKVMDAAYERIVELEA